MTHEETLRLALEALKEITLEHGMTEKARTAIKAALEAKDEETELEKDAVNLLFALHDAWPYVHQHCTIEAKKKSIQALIVKHGDFADLHPPPPQRKPLTEIALLGAYEEEQQGRWGDHVRGLRAIEAAHGIKDNT